MICPRMRRHSAPGIGLDQSELTGMAKRADGEGMGNEMHSARKGKHCASALDQADAGNGGESLP
jgi:hypothetical protein